MMQAAPPTGGRELQATVQARNLLAIAELPNLPAVAQAAVDPAIIQTCFVCLTQSPPPEPCGCACSERHVHAGCQASLADLQPLSTRRVLSRTTCRDCNYMLGPWLILRVMRVPQPFLSVSGSAELQHVIDAEVIAAAQLATGRPRLAIVTLTAGLKLAIELLDVMNPASKVVKEICFAGVIRITELAALANAAAGKYNRAQDFMAAVHSKRQLENDRSDAAKYSAIVTASNKHFIDALRRVYVTVSPSQLDMFAELGTSMWRTESFTLGVLATNLGACLFMQAVVSLADITLAARLSVYAVEAMSIACGRQHRHTQQAARNATVVLGELDRHGAESDGSTRSTRIRTQVRPGYWPGLMKPVITRDAGTCHIPRLGRTVC